MKSSMAHYLGRPVFERAALSTAPSWGLCGKSVPVLAN